MTSEYEAYANTPKSMATLFTNRELQVSNHEYEYQEVCSDLQKDFGKLVWTLPHKEGITEYKIRKAGEIARSRGILKFAYLVGIIKKLP
jgi:hypothetical protein